MEKVAHSPKAKPDEQEEGTLLVWIFLSLLVGVFLVIGVFLWEKEKHDERREQGAFVLSAEEMRGVATMTPDRFSLPWGYARASIYQTELARAGALFAMAYSSLSDPVVCAVAQDGSEHMFFAHLEVRYGRDGREIVSKNVLHPILENPIPGLCAAGVARAYAKARDQAGMLPPAH